ncbi:SagB/ThcOx family dehydrogenase [Phormidesmis sp. 146-33]
MRQPDLNYLAIAFLIIGSFYLLVSGIIMDTQGVHRFAFHGQVGYAWVAVAVLHLLLSWNRVKAYWGHHFRHHSQHRSSAHPVHQSTPATGRRNLFTAVVSIAAGFIVGRLLPQGTQTPEHQDMGILYHEWSKPGYKQALGALFNWGEQPPRYKTYPDAEQVELPKPQNVDKVSLETAITTRRSRRDYTNAALSLPNLSQVLHLAQGITDQNRELRAVPSAGALYPLEIYVFVHQVEQLPSGIYHYAIQNHRLERLKEGDFRAAILTAGLGQDFLAQANVCFVISAIFQRTRWKYHERTYRYVLMEAGHLGQNLYLAATALGLGACAIGAFLDNSLNELLELDGQQEAALYIVTIGQVEN